MNQQHDDSFERHIVLVCPDVHWNTGNIGRTCIATDTYLHLIKPLGFSLESKQIKRAGLDYWPQVKLSVWETFEAFETQMAPEAREMFVFAKLGSNNFRTMVPSSRMFLVFGSETNGIPRRLREKYCDRLFHIPITGNVRSLNLSTAAGIALYESLRAVDGPVHAYRESSESL